MGGQGGGAGVGMRVWQGGLGGGVACERCAGRRYTCTLLWWCREEGEGVIGGSGMKEVFQAGRIKRGRGRRGWQIQGEEDIEEGSSRRMNG